MMDRFREPTKQEEDWQAAMEMIYDELFDELGREPTDEEIHARADEYEDRHDSYIDSLIDDYKLIEREENE